jgi:putative endonuclease
MQGSYFTYIVASRSRTLYIGVTNNLVLRVNQHKYKLHQGSTAKYNCHRLVWFELFEGPIRTIAREKQLKRWTRAKKIALIERTNPTWEDLSNATLPPPPSPLARHPERAQRAEGPAFCFSVSRSPRPSS